MIRRGLISQVARLTGIHASTVGRILSGKPVRCRDSQRGLVMEEATRLGWTVTDDTPVELERASLVLATRLDLSWQGTVYEGLPDTFSDRADRAGFDSIFAPLSEPEDWQQYALMAQAAGVFIHEGLADWLPQLGMDLPAMLFNWPGTQPDGPFDLVIPDDAGGMRQLAQHLLELGHRHLLYLDAQTDRHTRSRHDRVEALVSTCQPGNGRVQIIPPNPAIMLACLRQVDPPTAIVLYSMVHLPRVYAALQEAGIRVPNDVNLACADDSSLAGFHHPEPTRLQFPLEQLVQVGIDQLQLRIQRPLAPQVVHRVPVKLVRGGTTQVFHG